MAKACPIHGWDVGELGCVPCDEKNSDTWGWATVQVFDAARAMREATQAITLFNHYWCQVNDPKIVGV